MSPSRSPPDAVWEQVKETLRQRYLLNNETAPALHHYLVRECGWKITVRILKTQFTKWGWGKKFTKLHYGAMRRILHELGDVDFLKPIDGGAGPRVRKTGQKVLKEIKRQTQDQEKKAEPKHVPYVTLETAHAVLREAAMTWVPHLVPADHGAQKPDFLNIVDAESDEPHVQVADDHEDDDDDDDYDDDDEHDDNDNDDNSSTASDDSGEKFDTVADRARRLNLSNFQQQPQSFKDTFEALALSHSRILGALPYASALLVDLHSNMFPHTPEYEIRGHVDTTGCYDNLALFTHPSTYMSTDYTNPDIADDSAILHPDTSGRGFIIDALGSHYRAHDQNGHRKEVMRFCYYYVLHLLANHETADEYDSPPRQAYREVFSVMLHRQNMELLPAWYWLVNVIVSYDRPGLLLALFEDSFDYTEASSSYLAIILRPCIRFIVLRYRDTFQSYVSRVRRLQEDSLSSTSQTFDALSELQQGINHLERTGNGGSNTGLILRLCQAWHLAEMDPGSGLSQLLECSHKSQAAFGPKHLITIRCDRMVGSTYTRQKKPDLALAETHLRTALLHLNLCSRVLEPTYHGMLFELAKSVLLGQGRLDEARYDLEVVFDFYLRTLGAQSWLTWEAALLLFDVMQNQGFAIEARQRELQLRALVRQQRPNRC